MKSCRVWSLCALVVLVCSALLQAQDTSSITGTVTDPTGAAVTGANVTLASPDRGVNRTAVTNASGDYLFAAVAPGTYDLTIEAAGFKRYQAKGVILRVATKSRVDVALQVGAASSEITVEGTAVAQVETQSSDLGNTVGGKEITQLELNGRDFTQLLTLSAGVSNQSGSDEGGQGASTVAFSINGGRTEYNNFEVDGGDTLDNGSNTTINVYPSIDAIAEFKVLSSNYGAQYGKNGSGSVEVETKSGTSSFHGDVYEFLRNDAFNATQWGLTSVPAYKKHDFGFTIGGPVFIPRVYNTNKQKTFFFWSEEWRRELVPATSFFSTQTVPTMNDRMGDFSDQCPAVPPPSSTLECPLVPAVMNGGAPPAPLVVNKPFPNNNLAPYIANTSISTALTALLPQPNVSSGLIPGVNDQWFLPPTLPTHWRQELFKIDHNITDKIRANFRYIHDSWNQQYPVPLWTDGTTFPTVQTGFSNPGVSMVARLTASVSPTLLNEFVASYTTDHIATKLTGPWQRGNCCGNLGLFDNGFGFDAPKVPGVSLNDSQYLGIAEDPGYVPNGPLNSNPTITIRDNVTKIIGRHNLQFGIYYANAHKNELPQPPTAANGLLSFANSSNGSLNSSGNAYADLLLGNVSSFTQQQAQLKMHNFYKIYEPFVQDDWHVTSRLTLNLGIRFSFFGTYRELNNLSFNFDPRFYVPGNSGVDPATSNAFFAPSTTNPFNGWVQCGVTPGVPAGCMSNHWWNPAPRLGFAYDLFGDGKWAVRGGYGIFYEHMNGNESNTDLLEPFNNKTQTTSKTNIFYSNLNPSLLVGGSPPIVVASIPSKATWPYVQQWHLDVQHDLGRGTVATVSYVGSSGTHLTRAFAMNQIFPVPLSQNPYGPGQLITPDDCNSVSIGADLQATATANVDTTNPVTTTGSWANNLAVACGNDPNPYRPFLGFGAIGRKDQTGSSIYHGLQAGVRRNVGSLQLNFAYTYSHSIDDSSSANDAGLLNTYALNSLRASSNFDQRHNLTIGYVYDLPFMRGKSLRDKLLGGWQWSGITTLQSGTPFSVYNVGFNGIAPGDNAGVGNLASPIGNLGGLTAGSYPDVIGNPRAGVVNTPSDGFHGPLLYNPTAFAAPRGLTFGDAPRNFLNNPWRTNFDMALIKHFPITESKYFEFRAEAFNIFNHTEFNTLGGDGGSQGSNSGAGNSDSVVSCYDANNVACTNTVSFLRSGSAHEPRILQLALKFIF
jgi:hypothetical protein